MELFSRLGVKAEYQRTLSIVPISRKAGRMYIAPGDACRKRVRSPGIERGSCKNFLNEFSQYEEKYAT